jgi:uncharacterized cupredoxin-like copper-binding protein
MFKHFFIILISFTVSISTALADKSMKIGKKGKQEDVTRIIKVLMYDNYFEPNSFKVQSGETIKFEVENVGELVHEFNIANQTMHKDHQSEMQKLVEMEIILADSIDKMSMMDKSMDHSHANSVLLEPKESKDLIWKFENASNIEIACNVPGHYDVGMIAKVEIN